MLVAVPADAPPDDLADHAEARALARATAAGDRQAATSFARRLLPVARRVTRALLGSGTDADDVSQSALIELLESARTYAGQGPLEAWARRITVRVTMRWLRRGRRLAVVAHDEDDPGSEPPTSVTTSASTSHARSPTTSSSSPSRSGSPSCSATRSTTPCPRSPS
ncbi:RNA polymerase sigma factor [Nannocystis pusilla]|uniref:RNA polymerase sigma factor n=1 Tax=Nannocystis pusilla TaxID=889268 RepID=UPI003B7D05F5